PEHRKIPYIVEQGIPGNGISLLPALALHGAGERSALLTRLPLVSAEMSLGQPMATESGPRNARTMRFVRDCGSVQRTSIYGLKAASERQSLQQFRGPITVCEPRTKKRDLTVIPLCAKRESRCHRHRRDVSNQGGFASSTWVPARGALMGRRC